MKNFIFKTKNYVFLFIKDANNIFLDKILPSTNKHTLNSFAEKWEIKKAKFIKIKKNKAFIDATIELEVSSFD